MLEIKVQKRFSYVSVLFYCAFIIFMIATGLWLITFVIKNESGIYDAGKPWFLGIFATIFAFLPILVKRFMSKEEYVSDLIITNKELQLVYRAGNKKIVSIKKIPKDNIKQVELEQTVRVDRSNGGKVVECTSLTIIDLTDGNPVLFREEASSSFCSDCSYGFLLKMLAAKNLLPNFKYTLDSNDNEITRDIEHYAQTGKRLSLKSGGV